MPNSDLKQNNPPPPAKKKTKQPNEKQPNPNTWEMVNSVLKYLNYLLI